MKREELAVATNKTHIYEPLFHVVKRDTIPLYKSMLIRVIAVAAGLLLCSLLSLILINANPVEFIETLMDASFGSERRMWKFAKDSAVLLCIALAITPAFRMKFWNIGAEGQVLIGALAAVAVAFYMGNSVPNWALLVIMFFAAIIVGAIWGGIPAIFKAKWGTNETLFTLMMNYAASGIVAYFLVEWTPSGSSVLGELKVGHLPQVVHPYFIIILSVLVLTVLVSIYLNSTKQGYEISVVGESENTARYIGINVKKVIIRTMLVSGAVCGIAGFLIVAGLDHSISETTVGGSGFTAIMVSWLAKFNPIVMILTAAFVTFLDQGASQMSTYFNIDSSFPDMVVGIVLFFIIGCEFFINYKLKFRSFRKKEVQ
ncbi:MAG: ABC transporter permease [Ruminococcaceae bacterium]|nr:ABC transporter permease [Oscillospiraceae bacterium]